MASGYVISPAVECQFYSSGVQKPFLEMDYNPGLRFSAKCHHKSYWQNRPQIAIFFPAWEYLYSTAGNIDVLSEPGISSTKSDVQGS